MEKLAENLVEIDVEEQNDMVNHVVELQCYSIGDVYIWDKLTKRAY
jgi:hypothetical protein